MAQNNSDSVGFLGYDIGVPDDQLNNLIKDLERVRKAAQGVLDAKQAGGLETTLTNTGKAAKGVSTELTASQKAVKTYSASVREAVALEKTGLATREATAKTIRGLTSEVKEQLGSLSKLGAEHRELATAMGVAGTAASRLEAAQVKANRALETDTLRGYQNALRDLQGSYERNERSAEGFIGDLQTMERELLENRSALDKTSSAYGGYSTLLKTTASNVKTASGEVTRLGLAQGVALGNTRKWGDGLVGLQGSIAPLLGGVGLVGLVTTAGRFVGEAQRAESASNLFAKSIERFGLDAGDANTLVTKLADQFGVLPSTVQGAATTMLRAGASLEDVDKALTAAGASAAASGFNISTAFDNVGTAVATGRSELLESSGIITNASTAYEAYAKTLGVSTDALTQAQKVQALSSAIYEESRFEIEDLTSVLTPQVKAQQAFRTSLAEARQELGERFAPTLATGATAVAGLLEGFTGLPETTQASVTGIGGVTAGVAVLGTALGALRPLLAATLAPPVGAIVLGVTAVAALATAFQTLATDGRDLEAEISTLKGTLETNAQGFATVQTAIGELTKVTDKDGFLGVVETLASTLDEKGAASLRRFAQTTALPLVAQGKLQEAIQATIGELGNLERETLNSTLASAQGQYNAAYQRVVSLGRLVDSYEDRLQNPENYPDLPFTAADVKSLNTYRGALIEAQN